MGIFEKKKTINLKIDGMHCEKCAAKVENALSLLGKTKVDLKLGEATVTCPDKTNISDIITAVEKLGFSCSEK